MKLHQIAREYAEFARLTESEEPGMAEAALHALDEIGGTFEQKAEAIATASMNRAALVAAIDGEIERLQARKKVIQNEDARYTEYLRTNMEAIDKKRISTTLFSITLVAGSQRVEIDDEDKIPDEFMRVKPAEIAPDKKAILAKLREGGEVPGTHIEVGNSSIRIK